MSLRQTSKSMVQRRLSFIQTPFSKTSYSSKIFPKQEVNISDIYTGVKEKLGEMESAFKSQNLIRERQMMKTYMKILDKIGEEVICAKQKYKGLNKQHLKTDKRLQLVTVLNNERSQCNLLANHIKQVREQIKAYEDENNFLEKQVEALEEIQNRKRKLSKSQKKKCHFAKLEISKSMQKKLNNENDQNQEQNQMVFSLNQSLEISKTYDLRKNRVKSFVLNKSGQQEKNNKNPKISEFKVQQGFSQKNKKHIGNRRTRHKFVISPFQQKISSEFF